MAAVESDNVAKLPNNKELQEICHHINVKHRVHITFHLFSLALPSYALSCHQY